MLRHAMSRGTSRVGAWALMVFRTYDYSSDVRQRRAASGAVMSAVGWVVPRMLHCSRAQADERGPRVKKQKPACEASTRGKVYSCFHFPCVSLLARHGALSAVAQIQTT